MKAEFDKQVQCNFDFSSPFCMQQLQATLGNVLNLLPFAVYWGMLQMSSLHFWEASGSVIQLLQAFHPLIFLSAVKIVSSSTSKKGLCKKIDVT